jgi:hypothetical protein
MIQPIQMVTKQEEEAGGEQAQIRGAQLAVMVRGCA